MENIEKLLDAIFSEEGECKICKGVFNNKDLYVYGEYEGLICKDCNQKQS